MERFYYLIHIQYLGFRFHGWMVQPDVKTIQKMVDKTVRFICGHENFKTLGSSRTDAKVSATEMAFELFIFEKLDEVEFLDLLNLNLPNDIRATSVREVDSKFNVIQHSKIKEYIYFFAFGEKPHPFSAPFIATFLEDLDVDEMKKAAALFEGRHNFRQYCKKPSPHTILEREVLTSHIEENDIYTANFFPEKSFAYRVKASGFLRNQVRLMMGQLLEVGRGNKTIEDIRESLKGESGQTFDTIAPAAGLVLHSIEFE
ncbi:tRNA pseudouridine synthase A [Halocola ammonii]